MRMERMYLTNKCLTKHFYTQQKQYKQIPNDQKNPLNLLISLYQFMQGQNAIQSFKLRAGINLNQDQYDYCNSIFRSKQLNLRKMIVIKEKNEYFKVRIKINNKFFNILNVLSQVFCELVYLNNNCYAQILKDIQGVKFKNIVQLNLCGNKIESVQIFQNLTLETLKSLILKHNNINNVQSFKKVNFKHLQQLFIHQNRIIQFNNGQNFNFRHLKNLWLQSGIENPSYTINQASNLRWLPKTNIPFQRFQLYGISPKQITNFNKILTNRFIDHSKIRLQNEQLEQLYDHGINLVYGEDGEFDFVVK